MSERKKMILSLKLYLFYTILACNLVMITSISLIFEAKVFIVIQNVFFLIGLLLLTYRSFYPFSSFLFFISFT